MAPVQAPRSISVRATEPGNSEAVIATSRMGTRGSELALVQARRVARVLEERGWSTETTVIRTRGDDGPPRDGTVIGKSLWTQEIEEALVEGRIDIAVHSLKDLPGDLPEGLELGGVLPREDPRDVLITKSPLESLAGLPSGARIGTASTRRRAALLHARPDLVVVPVRGNVGTRLAKLESEDLDGIVLAAAGLARLGLAPPHTMAFEPNDMMPALCQGIIGVESRQEDGDQAWMGGFRDGPTVAMATAERSLLRTLDVGCGAPVGGMATLQGTTLRLLGVIYHEDGGWVAREEAAGEMGQAAELGESVGRLLLEKQAMLTGAKAS